VAGHKERRTRSRDQPVFAPSGDPHRRVIWKGARLMRYYLDTEFDGYGGPLLSLAMVRADGESIYLIRDFEPMDLWVQQNVRPILFDCPVKPVVSTDPAELAFIVARFLSADPAPYVITDWPADIRYLCELIEFPGGLMAPIHGLTLELRRVDSYPTKLTGAVQHNAWWDAMALRELLERGERGQGPASAHGDSGRGT
jgi:hypothetical protein